jgi:hypothetical protein
MVSLWSFLAETGRLPAPSTLTAEGVDEAVLEGLVRRLVPDLPGPHPVVLYDPVSGRAMAAVVETGLARLHTGRGGLLEAIARVPAPGSPAAHLTQAAIGLVAMPIARRMRSAAFEAANQGAGEHAEAAGDALEGMLARAPLLSMREGVEDFFAEGPPPTVEGLEGGLRRWVIQRLSSPEGLDAAARRRAATLGALKDGDLRELLVLASVHGRLPDAVLAACGPLADRGGWPDDLAPGLRTRMEELRHARHEDA